MGKNVDPGKKMYRDFDYLDEFVKLSHFADIGIGIAAAKTIKEGMRRIMEKIGDIFAPLSWYLVLQDRSSGEFYYKLVSGVGAERLKEKRFPKGEGTIGWIFRNEAPLLIEDMRKDDRFSSDFHKNTGFEIRSMMGVPLRVDDEAVRLAVISKLAWIKRQQKRFQTQERQSAREYVSRESHYYFGNRYLLNIIEHKGRSRVEVRNQTIIDLFVPEGADKKESKYCPHGIAKSSRP